MPLTKFGIEPIVEPIFQCDLSYNGILNSAKPLYPLDLNHVTDLNTLRLLVCEMKNNELKWDIKYHTLANELERRNPDLFEAIIIDLQ